MSGLSITPAMSAGRAHEIAQSFDLRDLPADFYANPYPVYAALRESAPVAANRTGETLAGRTR